jgi:hypothetical protein
MFLLLLAFPGCLRPNPPEPPGPEWRATMRLRPHVITSSGGGPSSAEILEAVAEANVIWGRTGLKFAMLTPERRTDGGLAHIDNAADWVACMTQQRNWYLSRNELCFWIVEGLEHFDDAGGVANYPSNTLGIYRFGILVRWWGLDTGEVLAHELAHHVGNVPHPWDEVADLGFDLLDTQQTQMAQGCDFQPCLIINYCWPGGVCAEGDWFTPMQVELARTWAVSESRVKALIDVKVSKMVFTRAKATQIGMDRQDPVVDGDEFMRGRRK